MEEDEPADELSVMDDDDDDDDYELGRSLQSQQEPDAPEDELSAENSLEEEGSRALGHDSLSNPEEQEEAENSEEVLKRKLDKLITMTDKDVFDTYYEESKERRRSEKLIQIERKNKREAFFHAEDLDNHVKVVGNKIFFGQQKQEVDRRQAEENRQLRLMEILRKNATWAEAATRGQRFHHYEDFDLTKPVFLNADQELVYNWAGCVRGPVALRKGYFLPSFPVVKETVQDFRFSRNVSMPDPTCPPITHQVELFPLSLFPLRAIAGEAGASIPLSRRATCLPFPLDQPPNSSIRQKYYQPIGQMREVSRRQKKAMMNATAYSREFVEMQYRKAEQRRSGVEEYERHLKRIYPYQDILPGGFLNETECPPEQPFSLGYHWYLGSEDRKFGLPKDRGGGMEIEGGLHGGMEKLGDPKRGFGTRWERLNALDVDSPAPPTFQLDDDRFVLEDGSVINKRTGLRELLNGTIVPLEPVEEEQTTCSDPVLQKIACLTDEQMSNRLVLIMQAHKERLYSLIRPSEYGNKEGDQKMQDENVAADVGANKGEAAEEEDAGFVRIPAGKHVDNDAMNMLMKTMSRGAKEGKELRISAGLHRWMDKLRFQAGETRWINPSDGEEERTPNQGWIRIRGDVRGDTTATGRPEGACFWGQWKVYHGTRGWIERVSLFLDTDCCYRPTFQVQGGNWSLTDCEVRAILTITILVRDFAALKMKDCVIGGCDYGWFVAMDGVVVKDRARVRMKGGRGEYVSGLGCVASADGMSELMVEKMMVHRCYFGVKVNGEGVVRLRDSIFRDIRHAALYSGSITRKKQELVLFNNSFFCEMWFGECRPGNLEGFSSCWNETLAGPLPVPWIPFCFPPELEADRMTCLIPPTKEETLEYDRMEKARYEKMYQIIEEHGGNISNITDYDLRYQVEQRMQELENVRRYEEAEARGEDLVAEYRKTCWCKLCATPHYLVPPQLNNGSALFDEEAGCWAVPVYNDGKNWTEEIEELLKREKEEKIMRMIDVDKVNITEHAAMHAELSGCSIDDMLQLFEEYVQSYMQQHRDRTRAQATRRLRKELLRLYLVIYQANCLADNPKRYRGLDGELTHVYQKGTNLFNVDYGDSSEEEYNGIRRHLKPGGVGWYVYNRTKFEEEVTEKMKKQKGIGTIDDVLPQEDGSYVLPDPWVEGRSKTQSLVTPFHVHQGFRLPDEHYLTQRNASFKGKTSMFAGADVDEAWDQMGNPLMPMEEMEKEKNRTSVLYRPGSNLLHFGPFAGDLNEAVLANEEGKVLVDSSGEEIMVSHRDYCKAVWDRTVQKRNHSFDVPVSANYPPPLVRIGKRIKFDSTSWARTIMHPGCEWTGDAPSMDPATWPNPYDPS